MTLIIALAKISMNAKIQAHVNRIVLTLTARLNVLVPLDTFWKMIGNHARNVLMDCTGKIVQNHVNVAKALRGVTI